MKKFLPLLFLAAVFFCVAAPAPAAAPETLVIISPHWEGIRREFTRGFQAWYKRERKADVDIKWLDQGGTSDDLRFIRSEFARNPAGIGVDLFWGGGVDPYVELASENLLEPAGLPASVLKSIPADLNGVPLYDARQRWIGNSLAGFGILYNRKLVKTFRLPNVSSWEDLASPKLIGWVGSGDPRHSGSVHIMYELVLQKYGWEKGWSVLLRMGANVKTFPKSAAQTQKDLATGEAAYGLSIDTYAYSAIEEIGADKLGFIFPKTATVVTPDPIALLKGAPNSRLARDFIRYSVTPEAQRLWLYRKGVKGGPREYSLNKMSVLPAVYKDLKKNSIVQVDPFKQRTGFRYDFKKGSSRWNLLNDLIGVFLIDNHKQLADAWKAVAKNKKKQKAFLAFPVSEKDAAALAASGWEDPVTRNKTINAWLRLAQKKYTVR